MSRRARRMLFLAAIAVAGTVLIAGFTDLPGFGHYRGPYGKVLNDLAVPQRHGTDVVTAVNFDYRAFDTLGEEFLLFGSAVGVAVLLRPTRGERQPPRAAAADERRFAGASPALRALSIGLISPLIVLGAYIVTHGQLTPGGGFQGGVILATAPLMAFLAGRVLAFKMIATEHLVEAGEAFGAAGYALIGLGGLVFSGVFFHNFLPMGLAGHLLSGGTMPLSSIAVGLEVAGAFLLVWTELLDQAMLHGPGRSSGGGS